MIKNTGDIQHQKVKIAVYGNAGAGKTHLCATAPKPIIISAESGLLSLAGQSVDYIDVKTKDDIRSAYEFLLDDIKYETICIDSISEIAEVVLSNEKQNCKDPRQAYGAMQETMTRMIRSFRDLDKHIYMTSKLDKVQDEVGRISYGCAMPGTKLGRDIPYFFDEVFALRNERNQDGEIERMLMCHGDQNWTAKDRSGKLNNFERPNIGEIIQKILNHG